MCSTVNRKTQMEFFAGTDRMESLSGEAFETLPEVFCWTKMGVEAGQSLEAIVHRKELERQNGNGLFVWGVGNALGSSIQEYGYTKGTIPLLFSPIRSKPRQVDASPIHLFLWLSYVDGAGNVQPLPEHSLVTSGGLGEEELPRKRHYALFCHSQVSLHQQVAMEVDFDELYNRTSNKPVGFSQVTAFVRRTPGNLRTSLPKKTYQVPFRADLISPFYARLAHGFRVPKVFASRIENFSKRASPSQWGHFVRELREQAKEKTYAQAPLLDLTFD